ncbi:VanZ family protein [Piscinibacter sp.]|uniref:VanZ family protein n=1 Tax=Piscinibacter sp. TaxID=1903157 RepID=UPI002F425695
MPLAGMYAALIVYASLYPFAGWRVPGVSPWDFLTLTWPHWWTGFDLVFNLLGYMPLGALLFGAAVRSGWSVARAFALALAVGAGLSTSMEFVQNYLPLRVASNLDLALNVAGTAVGALLGALVHALGGIERWQAVRDRWFIDRSAGGLTLLLLWPIGLLFPVPVPLGAGQVWPHLRDGLAEWLQGTMVSDWTEPWLQPDADLSTPLAPGSEFVAIVFGLLAPCLVAFTIARPGWRRLLLALGAAGVAFATTTLSTALNFGPQHALAWRTETALAGLVTGLTLALALAWVARRAAAGLGLVALAVLVALVGQAPSDPYFAESLQAWEQGRFIRFHGAAQWVGWLWPYAAMAYLLARIGAREP